MQALLDDVMETTEVHWSTGTILAVFFAASLISAVFFGLGYSFGGGGTAKPALGMALSGTGSAQDAAVRSESTPSDRAKMMENMSAKRTAATVATVPVRTKDSATSAAVTLATVSAIKATHAAVIPANATRPAVAGARHSAAEAHATHYMVQVGAIGDRRDARLLVSKLRKKGFHAGIYPGKHDKYLHVQIGPYATMQQAQTVRHRVAVSGYHAILKHVS